MEAGENPARSRHCKEGVLSKKPLVCINTGKAGSARISKPGDMHKSQEPAMSVSVREGVFDIQQQKRAGANQA